MADFFTETGKRFKGTTGKISSKVSSVFNQGGGGEKFQGKEWKVWQATWDALSQADKNRIRNLIARKGGNPDDTRTVLMQVADADTSNSGNAQVVSDNIKNLGLSTEYTAGADLERQQKIDELIKEEQESAAEFLTSEEARRVASREKLAGLLAEQREIAFDENAPQIQEQLASKGLLHSSAVGEALADEQSRLQALSENVLAQQELSDQDILSQFAIGSKQREFGIREAGLEREFSLEDLAMQSSLAREIAEMQSQTAKDVGKMQLIGQLLGTAATGAAAYFGAKG